MGCPLKKVTEHLLLETHACHGTCFAWHKKTTSTTNVSKEAMLQLQLRRVHDWLKRSSNIWIWNSWCTITHEIINCSFAWTHKKNMKSRRKQADHEYLEEGNPKWWFIHSMQQKNWDSRCYSCRFAAEGNLSLQKRFMIVVTYMEGKL